MNINVFIRTLTPQPTGETPKLYIAGRNESQFKEEHKTWDMMGGLWRYQDQQWTVDRPHPDCCCFCSFLHVSSLPLNKYTEGCFQGNNSAESWPPEI